MNLKDLLTIRYFDADKGGQGGSGADSTANSNGQTDDGASSDGSQKTETVPYSRFKEVNDSYKTLKQELDQLKQAQAQKEQEEKEQQGQYESLYNELKQSHEPLKQEYTQLKDTFKSILATKKEAVPEEMRDLIPSGSELEQLKWIEQAQAKGLFNKEKVTDFGNNGNNPSNDDKKLSPGFLKNLQRKRY